MSIRLEYEKDPERLCQAALVLESENRRLTADEPADHMVLAQRVKVRSRKAVVVA